MSAPLLRRVRRSELPSLRRRPIDAEMLAQAAGIVVEVRDEGEPALRRYAERFGEISPGAPYLVGRDALEAALRSLSPHTVALLDRTATRIRDFAQAQRRALAPVEVPVLGGQAGHTLEPVERAGCYAPAGRFALPSTVLMTVVPARVAGVRRIVVASPKPSPVILAAAAIAGADGVLCAGGAHAIAALAYGVGSLAASDVVVGPGNRWVTAAKQLVAGQVAIDMLAGPSELVVLADETAEPEQVAADLLAQAEHDPDARVVLLTPSASLASTVDAALARQLAALPTASIASAALAQSFVVLVDDLAAATEVCDELAPEHVHVVTRNAQKVAAQLKHYGALFVGPHAAEVLGDYGAGPNHVLPTGGTARSYGGLSVYTFLRVRTWLRIDDPRSARELARDAAALADLEGLAGHAASARLRAG